MAAGSQLGYIPIEGLRLVRRWDVFLWRGCDWSVARGAATGPPVGYIPIEAACYTHFGRGTPARSQLPSAALAQQPTHPTGIRVFFFSHGGRGLFADPQLHRVPGLPDGVVQAADPPHLGRGPADQFVL
eukprot:444050-Pyramimonas_sp.AAC.1